LTPRNLAHIAGALLLCLALGADGAPLPYRNAGDFRTDASLTCGIQEAVDSLPEGGGAVYVPEGVHVLARPLILPPRTRLIGAGKATVIRKNALFQVLLEQDASKGSQQNHVVVRDPAKLRAGMLVILKRSKGHAYVVISAIEGKKVFVERFNIYSNTTSPWTPERDLLVAERARVVNSFSLVYTRDDCWVSDLSLDGAKEEQTIGGEEFLEQRCFHYLRDGCIVERCVIHDAPGLGMYVGAEKRGVIVDKCEIFGCWQGVHTGGGPWSRIINNDIHDNKNGGIAFCYGNRGLIISHNRIHRNGFGIEALGIGDPKRDATADRHTIISGNVIAMNKGSAIVSGQGPIGPQDFIFTGNVVRSNCQERERRLGDFGNHLFPAGIALYNAKRCIVTSNRCLDDQDWFTRKLAEDVHAGEMRIVTQGGQSGIGTGSLVLREGSLIRVRDGDNAECVRVRKVRELKHLGPFEIILAKPLAHDYRVNRDAEAAGMKTQSWGLFIGGPEAEDNLVSNNICAGNLIGGVLWSGRNAVVKDNVGGAVRLDEKKPLHENVFPALQVVAVPNPGFESDAAWDLGKSGSYDGQAHSGKRSLKLTVAEPNGTVEATGELFTLKGSGHYRLSAWVRSNAGKGGKTAAPGLILFSEDWTPLSGVTALTWELGKAKPNTLAPAPGEWTYVMTEALTGGRNVRARIYCALAAAQGEAWIDDVRLDRIPYAPPAAGGALAALPELQLPFVRGLARIDGRLDDELWQQAARSAAFRFGDGAVPAEATRLLACHDAENLYFAFQCEDRNPALVRKAATEERQVWSDDAVAFVLSPDPAGVLHYQFGLSAGGARFDQMCTNGVRDTADFSCAWQAAATVDETGWTGEMAVPMALVLPHGAPGGRSWRANFFRHMRNGHDMFWAPTDNAHRVRDYGRLVFASPR